MALIVQPQRERGLVFRSGCCPSGGRLRTIDRRHKGGLAHHAAAESGRGRKGFRNAVLRLADRVFLRSRLNRQIGRASCRERVCQHVSYSVVAVSIKKKTCAISNKTKIC